MKQLGLILSIVFFSNLALSQEFGAIAGIHRTDAQIDDVKLQAELGYRAGGVVKFGLTDTLSIRTGVMYVDRSFDVTDDVSGTNLELGISYLDIPALLSVSMTETFQLYFGPVFAINVREKAKGTVLGVEYNDDISNLAGAGAAGPVGDIKKLYILAQTGATFMFNNIGVDVYIETGFGDIWDNGAKHYGNIGTNVTYWF